MTGRTPARLLAPIALAATALALFLILAGGGGGDDGDAGSPAPREPAVSTPGSTEEGGDDDASEEPAGDERPRKRTYTVRPGDTPSGIAEEVGIPLQELLDLNPEVDPQTLSPGQKLRVR